MASLKTNKIREPKTRLINKLVIVGNGFDLALGLKTKYEDFLFWYFKNFIVESLKQKQVVRDRNGNDRYSHNQDDLFMFYNDTNYSFEENHILGFMDNMDSYATIKNYILNGRHKFTYHFKSKLLKEIFDRSIRGWVDLESVYFDLLKKSFKNKNNNEIDELNKDLSIIRELLHKYLSQLDYSKTLQEDVALKYNTQFSKDVSLDDISEYSYYGDEMETGHILFLNFNYTESLSNINNYLPNLFIKDDRSYEISHIQIHGSVKYGSNSLIFGYGDEMDKDYKNIEELNDNKYFENIKSFKYLQDKAYSGILQYIDAEEYQIVIYGHSCGLSDRVLLNELFEHKNCKSIKIYYYNKQEFINKTMDISRHFNSNQLMRKKIVAFNYDDVIPQTT